MASVGTMTSARAFASAEHRVRARRGDDGDSSDASPVRIANRGTMPPGTPMRFRDDQVFDALNRVLPTINANAKITTVDCDEYPCLVYGTGFGTAKEASALRTSDEMRDYATDRTQVFGWGGDGGDGSQSEFAIAIYPQPESEGDDPVDRLHTRVQKFRDTPHE